MVAANRALTGVPPIMPTIGRMMWYRPAHDEKFAVLDWSQALSGQVIFVHDLHSVNLKVTDHKGFDHVVEGCPIVQPGEQEPEEGKHFACWMPYQQGQAERARQAEEHARISGGGGKVTGNGMGDGVSGSSNDPVLQEGRDARQGGDQRR